MTVPPAVVPLVRQFASNGFKYLFSRGDNVGDLLRWRVPDLAVRIDFARMAAQPDTFVAPGFTQLESDVLLRAPFRARRRQSVEVYVLIENQAEPDELMVFRALRYVLAVYDRQLQEWLRAHDNNPRGFRFHPVLPIVFYSGTRSWDAVTPFHDLVHEGARFGAHLPALEPVFINLARADEAELRTGAGVLGPVLHLVQQRRRDEAGFRAVLQEAVRRVDALPARQGERADALLWYAHAFVYHERDPAEYEPLVDFIRGTVREARRAEVRDMGRTIADMLREEGEKKGQLRGELKAKRETLLRLMRLRFRTIPPALEATVQSEEDEAKLDTWLDAFATARKLSDIPFPSTP